MSSLESNVYTKIDKPNYTQIPNVIFDYWMPKLSLGAQSILFAICRKTFGWHKTSDTISKNQLMNCTGMSKNTIQKAIEELEKLQLLVKHCSKNEYGFQPNTYSLNIEKPIDPNLEESQNLGGGGSNSDLGVGQILTPQKKDIQKKSHVCDVPGEARLLHPDIQTTHPNGKKISIVFNEIMRWIALQKKDWTMQEIDDAWKILENYQNPITDAFVFIEGIVKKNRMKKEKIKSQEKVCYAKIKSKDSDVSKISKKPQETRKDFISMKDMWGPQLAKYDYQLRNKN